MDRLWPRGVKKTDLHLDAWEKDIAPSTELRRWFGHDPKRWIEFCKRYKLELKNPAASDDHQYHSDGSRPVRDDADLRGEGYGAQRSNCAAACLQAHGFTYTQSGAGRKRVTIALDDLSPIARPAAGSVGGSEARYEIDIAPPYRLDLTVSVLRRLSTNVVDLFTPEGEYVRVLDGFRSPVIVRVAQTQPARLMVVLTGCDGSDEHAPALGFVRRILGVDRTLSHFYRAAEDISWLWPLAVRMRGIKPPRYPTLWEACVNAIVFQQVSLFAASSISKRIILALGSTVTCEGMTLHAFPSAESLLAANDDILPAAGLSANKLSALRRVADALVSGLDEAMLEECSSPEAVRLLGGIKGIGPWTATVILLRGLGRLDVFPMNDSGVARNLALYAGAVPLDIDRVLAALGPQRGMLYYHLLLARLDARGEIGRASHGLEGLAG